MTELRVSASPLLAASAALQGAAGALARAGSVSVGADYGSAVATAAQAFTAALGRTAGTFAEATSSGAGWASRTLDSFAALDAQLARSATWGGS